MITIYSLRQTLKSISGGAVGADTLGEQYANERGYKIHRFIPDWSIGKQAGHLRNEVMAVNADAAIIFWDGKSRGTKSMIDISGKHNLKCRVIGY